mmetsp:Transcript_16655/g.32567  ORF Transcript_16655/g.32567 Transcript_16655/m.32567 type:complete len:355 (+) Transcript_16655:196-1260(+)
MPCPCAPQYQRQAANSLQQPLQQLAARSRPPRVSMRLRFNPIIHPLGTEEDGAKVLEEILSIYPENAIIMWLRTATSLIDSGIFLPFFTSILPATKLDLANAPSGPQLNHVWTGASAIFYNLPDIVHETFLDTFSFHFPFGFITKGSYYVVCVVPCTHFVEELTRGNVLPQASTTPHLGPLHGPKTLEGLHLSTAEIASVIRSAPLIQLARIMRGVRHPLPPLCVWIEGAKCSEPIGLCFFYSVNFLATRQQAPGMGDVASVHVIPASTMCCNRLLQDAGPQLASARRSATEQLAGRLAPGKFLVNNYVFFFPGFYFKVVQGDGVRVEVSRRERPQIRCAPEERPNGIWAELGQ